MATTMDFSTATGFRAQIAFYDPFVSPDFWHRAFIDWDGPFDIVGYTFQATDYIALRSSGTNDYPAIDCTFSAAFVYPYYLENNYFLSGFGTQESKIPVNSKLITLIFI